MATAKKTATSKTSDSDDIEVNEAEEAAFKAASQNPAIIAAAGITNGMPAEEQRARLLKAAGFIVSE